MDDAIQEFSLPSWAMSHYTMHTHEDKWNWKCFLHCNILFVLTNLSWEEYILGVFDDTKIPLMLVGYEMIINNLALQASLAIYHLISKLPACGMIV